MSANPKNIGLLLLFVLAALAGTAQITAPSGTQFKVVNQYDSYIFCASNETEAVGVLTATSHSGEPARFVWERYDPNTQVFSPFQALTDSTLASTIRNLEDGGYRVTINDGHTVAVYFAWVLNNWIEVVYAEIPDTLSNCESFRILAEYEAALLMVHDTVTGTQVSARNSNSAFRSRWYQGSDLVASSLSPTIYDLIASNEPVPYRLELTDEFECTESISIDYDSKIPKSDFIYDPSEGEAVLEVSFTNNSINYDSTYWFFYKDAYRLSKAAEATNGGVVDSIEFILTDDMPVHRYEISGEYQVKLVTVKMNDTGNCYDTLYMVPGTFIKVDTSLIEVPNVFTPNGDGVNDALLIKSQSLRSMNVKIYNRWGGLVHSWKYSNITSKDYTYEHAVWDGRIGGRMAAPGVYFYTITYEGRDYDRDKDNGRFKRRTEQGFIHLFREKN
ncbi:MAG: gliding motility-associated C-terminal domain-containing protein [Prolixibacteraceae bacterium]|nr:gliding motility-associated C-terminal domain-containing protein [Prolixibacteraceae bacterium]